MFPVKPLLRSFSLRHQAQLLRQSRIFPSRSYCAPANVPEPKPADLAQIPRWRLYAQLTKARLGSAVMLTIAQGYLLAPGQHEPKIFAITMLGAGLTVASALSANQYVEVELDRQMARTSGRPLVTGALSMNEGLTFSLTTGVTGCATLYYFANPLASFLALTTILSYVFIYGPLKQRTWLNTWFGAVVGAIPPLMGWAACAGDIMSLNAFLLPFAIFLVQIPHFLAISEAYKDQYQTSFKMLVNEKPNAVGLAALFHSLALFAVPITAVSTGYASPGFTFSGSLFAGLLSYAAFKFMKDKNYHKLLLWSTLVVITFFGFVMFCFKNPHNEDEENTIEEDQENTIQPS